MSRPSAPRGCLGDRQRHRPLAEEGTHARACARMRTHALPPSRHTHPVESMAVPSTEEAWPRNTRQSVERQQAEGPAGVGLQT